jgi:hypothetical protein
VICSSSLSSTQAWLVDEKTKNERRITMPKSASKKATYLKSAKAAPIKKSAFPVWKSASFASVNYQDVLRWVTSTLDSLSPDRAASAKVNCFDIYSGGRLWTVAHVFYLGS